ncbi:hypothetical protein K437DRAFT_254896 [Tilletiaria anomala UBC 951]|uniref:Copper transporter n=1 Tax=Tilletiaria anomala (strain ATCC 24038 / CBS 436.72 / UBC 951) TaxID=1037660 RepID=A0A066WJW8_TILAU|nr:uncharacterized protein K437DRAFT_254896 [Tilletiaria anomala UBC 951]KDN51309.1 hypothetical protein K437DRAFT_254896 [Tilletiaria anomala UBC 951]
MSLSLFLTHLHLSAVVFALQHWRKRIAAGTAAAAVVPPPPDPVDLADSLDPVNPPDPLACYACARALFFTGSCTLSILALDLSAKVCSSRLVAPFRGHFRGGGVSSG